MAFLFCSNALRVAVQRVSLPPDRAERLAELRDVQRIALAMARLEAGALLQANADVVDAAMPPPGRPRALGQV